MDEDPTSMTALPRKKLSHLELRKTGKERGASEHRHNKASLVFDCSVNRAKTLPVFQIQTVKKMDIGGEESWTWAYIGTLHKTRLIGTAYPEKLSAITQVPSVLVEVPSLSKKLSELKQLHDSHMLSDTEYDAARARAIEQFK